MRILKWPSSLVWVAAFAVLMLGPALAWAQVPSPAPPPSLRTVAAPWIGYLLIAVLVGIVLAISLMPSKRSHQD